MVHEDNLAGPIMSWHGHFREGTAGDVQVQKAFTSNHRLLLQDLKARSIETEGAR